MTEGLFCSFFTEERMDMKNNIAVQIESGYGDLRKSEKQAADYILNHMEEAAGLTEADVVVGISYSGEDLTNVPMKKRGFNIVFQDYALFPNLNVYQNITYGLRNKPEMPFYIFSDV